MWYFVFAYDGNIGYSGPCTEKEINVLINEHIESIHTEYPNCVVYLEGDTTPNGFVVEERETLIWSGEYTVYSCEVLSDEEWAAHPPELKQLLTTGTQKELMKFLDEWTDTPQPIEE